MSQNSGLWAAQVDILESSEFIVTAGLLVLALVGGGVVIYFLDRWKKRQTNRQHHRSIDALSTYRAMYERGDLSRDEYEAIRGHVSVQAKSELYDAIEQRSKKKPPP